MPSWLRFSSMMLIAPKHQQYCAGGKWYRFYFGCPQVQGMACGIDQHRSTNCADPMLSHAANTCWDVYEV